MHAHFQLPLKDKYFSRIHFMMEVNPPFCRLLDMGSHNGTYVNGQKVLSADLHDGDQIRAGHTVLQLQLLEGTIEGPALAAEESPSLEAALKLAGYKLMRELGRGPMGAVHLVEGLQDGKPAAMKIVRPTGAISSTHIDKFLAQARKLQAIDHPHLVRLRAVGQAGSLLYFLSDYVPGKDAAAIVKESGPLPIHRAVTWICQALQAVEQAHVQGLVHRDIKPTNLLVTQRQGGDLVKLSDFGLARVYAASQLSGLTITDNLTHSAAFMPPELLTNFQDARPAMDQYAAAATLYYLLTGQGLFNFPDDPARQFSVLLRHHPVPIRERRPDVPAALANAIHLAVARNPAQRFADVTQFRLALIQASG